ncbi:HtaA domain-containing protein [Leucobacter musarum]|uniref:HtaA domain-containing protein n=1 Tax=Leucobacter musarum TaxID=1930747 RepID=UPI000A892CB1|nr:HtaA domain-containing protein [Leucobacter musarum]
MNARIRRSGALLAGAAMIGGLLLAPTAAQAQPVRAENAASGACEVTGGSFTWGVKESFRAYISGSIANGSWEESDGATYETPYFSWGGATGSIDPETGEGAVSFTGTVHFTGHDGVLDLTLANPTIEFEGDGKAALLLDARSNDMEGKVAIDATQEWVGDVTVPDQLGVSDNALQLQDLPTKLTNSGAKAFAGFYEADIDLDPIAVDLQFASCADSAGGAVAAADAGDADESDAAATTDAPVATQTPAPVQASNDIPWLPIIIGGVAILVIGVTGGILLGGRKPKPAAPAAAPQSEAPQQPNPQATDKLFGDQQ